MFTYDYERHIYRVNGERKRSVSEIVTSDPEVDKSRFYTEAARWRGSRVHRDTTNLDLECFDGCACDEDALYVQSYKRWRDFVRPVWESIEIPRFTYLYDFGGTADRVGIDGMGRPIVLDLKTGDPARWHPLQLALYDLLHDDLPPRVRRRIGLYLRSDGTTAKAIEYKDPSDYDRALRLVRKAA